MKRCVFYKSCAACLTSIFGVGILVNKIKVPALIRGDLDLETLLVVVVCDSLLDR